MGDPLRDALADALQQHALAMDAEDLLPWTSYADAVLTTLVEHRDEVLGMLGMEQVGWWMPWAVDFHDEHLGAVPVYASAALIKKEPHE